MTQDEAGQTAASFQEEMYLKNLQTIEQCK
jgi:hypothetical protein